MDRLLIGGGMAFTFYKAQGKEIGGSLVEDDRVAKQPQPPVALGAGEDVHRELPLDHGAQFTFRRSGSAARRLLAASIVYLPSLFALMIVPRG